MSRPAWARWLDGVVVPATRVLGRLFSRPSEHQLQSLAGRQSALSPQTSPALAASDHIQRGRRALESEAFGEALHHFGQAIALHPEARWAWHGRGDALQLSGDVSAAQAAYDKAIALDPECGLHHAGRANALKAQDQVKAAEAAWSEALRLDPALQWMREG